MQRLAKALAGCLAVGAVSLATAAEIPVDLSSWEQRGPTANGTWTVSSDGNSVVQSKNQDPTFFVSPTNQFNTTIRGTLEVTTTGDDDFIGFVLGFNGPASTGNDMDFILFDWKQLNQNYLGRSAQEGFALSRVQGTITDYLPGFWGHVDSAGFSVLDTQYGSDEGWLDNTEYTFEILYQANRIKIDIAGGQFGTGQEIFDISGTFSDGRFGFYNYSQASVRYAGLTQEDTPPPTPNGVPVPAPLALLGVGMLALGFRRRRS